MAADDPAAVFAVRSGQFCEVTRPRSGWVWVSVRKAAHQDLSRGCVVVSGDHNGVVRIVAHECGWLGCRVGETANPGPRGVLRFTTQGDNQPGGELLDALERDLTPMVAPKGSQACG